MYSMSCREWFVVCALLCDVCKHIQIEQYKALVAEEKKILQGFNAVIKTIIVVI